MNLDFVPQHYCLAELGVAPPTPQAVNQTLSAELYDRGLVNITNVDFAETCIQQMSQLYESRSSMTWHVADIRDMHEWESDTFDLAIDKGTLDALLSYKGSVWSLPEDVKQSCERYMDEVHRVLKPNGTFLYVSYRQPHFAKLVVDRPYWKVQTQVLAGNDGSLEYFGYNIHNNDENNDDTNC
jgi:EEF1A lysine methyltransferase 4